MASALHLFYSMTDVRNQIMTHVTINQNTQALCNILNKMKNSSNSSINMNPDYNTLFQYVFGIPPNGKQQDPCQVLERILNFDNDGLNDVTTVGQLNKLKESVYFTMNEHSFCVNKNDLTLNNHQFRVLPLEIKDNSNIQQLLDDSTREEKLTFSYKLAKCSNNNNDYGYKQQIYTSSPTHKYLTIQLKRFNNRLQFLPLSIDLKYTINFDYSYYFLSGAIVFLGQNTSGGHYIYIRIINNKLNFVLYNDDLVFTESNKIDEQIKLFNIHDQANSDSPQMQLLKKNSYVFLYEKMPQTITKDQILIMTYNVFWKALEQADNKNSCINSATNITSCAQNITNAIIESSTYYATKNNITSGAVLDFITLQEIKNSQKQWELLHNKIKNTYVNFDVNYAWIFSDESINNVAGFVQTIYNKIKYEHIKSINVELDSINDIRICLISIFKRISDDKYIVVANCHMPHTNQNALIKKIMTEIVKLKTPNQTPTLGDFSLIFSGDFNQTTKVTNITQTVSQSEFEFINDTQNPIYESINTCCENSNFTTGWYDQIYHTKNLGSKIQYYQIPINYYEHNNYNYSSNHKPLIALIGN